MLTLAALHTLVRRPARGRLQRLDRAPELPDALPIAVAVIEHPVNHPRCLDHRIAAVAVKI